YVTLTTGTTDYYCAIGSNTAGTSFGSVLTFTSLPAVPSVSIGSASAISSTTATLNATVNPGGGTTTGWFRYSTTNPGSCNDTFGTRVPAPGGSNLGSSNGSVPLTQALTGLTQGTTYYFCAIASNAAGTGVSGVNLFTTFSAPTVTTNTITAITNVQAQLNGTANPNGDGT